jgi:hypothetical protein
MRKVGALILLGLSVGACGVGDEDYTPPDTDDRNEKLGIICDAMFTITGTFVAGTPARPPEAPTGCWPVGEWTFTAAVAENTCESAPVLLPSYRFTVGREEGADMQGWVDTYIWAGDQAAVRRLKVTEGGSGDCEGGLELFSADGTEFWNMKPAQEGGILSGGGEYAKYNENAR